MFNLSPPANFRGLDPNNPITRYSRNLPHWRQEGATYSVTFRLQDALPQPKIRGLQSLRREWLARHRPPRSDSDWQDYARQITVKTERWLDEGYGCCVLKEPEFAKVLADALLHFQDQRYFMSCFTIMPNHCHLLIRPLPGNKLETLLQGCKGYAAWKINQMRGASGTLWLPESYDRIVRDEEHLYNNVQYIGGNGRKAGIPEDQWVRWFHPTWEDAGWGFVPVSASPCTESTPMGTR